MQNVKRISVLIFSIICIFSFNGCSENKAADFKKVKIDYGVSSLYTRNDMNSAIEVIEENFSKHCVLHSISYTSDSYCGENLGNINSLTNPDGFKGGNFTQCIIFEGSFHTPKGEAAYQLGFNPDQEYDGWEWYLGRTGSGQWRLMDQGYA